MNNIKQLFTRRNTIIAGIVFILLFSLFGGCSRNVEQVKLHAPQTFEQAGFRIIGYEGYQIMSPIAGGSVWYTLKRINGDSTITYSASVEYWFGEYHIYSLRAIDAIQPRTY